MQRSRECWKVRATETALETAFFRIERNTCETPDGTVVPSYYVQHEKDAVMCLVMDREGRVLLEEQYRFPLDRISLDYPAGSVEASDRSLRAAARRELEEETGLRARKLERVLSVDKDPGSRASRMHVFLVREYEQGSRKEDPAETIRARFYTPEEVMRKMASGKLSCVFCVAATYYLARRFGWKDGKGRRS
jgi:8-oxo-dGTP pyrophosphatase MutT (NUDIX family)